MALRNFFEEEDSKSGIDLSPLIDMVFLLLLYFMVATTMEQTEGLQVQKAEAVTAKPLDRDKFKILLDSTGQAWLGARATSIPLALQEASEWSRQNAQGSILIVPDKRSPMGPFVQLLDGLKAKGIRAIAIGTARPPQP